MLLGGLELHRGHLVATKLAEDLASLLLRRRFVERAAQAHGRRARSATARCRVRRRPQCLHSARIAGRAGQQQMRGDPLG